MKNFQLVPIISLILLKTSALAYPPELQNHLTFICSQLIQLHPSSTSQEYQNHFTQDFIQAVPLVQIQSIFQELNQDIGSCTKFSIHEKPDDHLQVQFTGSFGINGQVRLHYNSKTTLIDGLTLDGIDDPRIHLNSWNDLPAAFNVLDDAHHFSATFTTQNHSLYLTQNANKSFSIGSTFKLYILGKLLESIQAGQLQWTEILPIHEEWKSLPSGTMQNIASGTPETLYHYAENMISISDNTATDHLLYFLGRENVEDMLPKMGNFSETQHLPLLSTLEMFKLKWAIPTKDTQEYLNALLPEKRKDLELLTQIPITSVGQNGIPTNSPTFIQELEWHATTDENCSAILWLGQRSSPELDKILSKNIPLIDSGELLSPYWKAVGFKGGSEPGVLSMTYLLKNERGVQACLSLTWNNPQRAISQNRFFDLVKKTLTLVQKYII